MKTAEEFVTEFNKWYCRDCAIDGNGLENCGSQEQINLVKSRDQEIAHAEFRKALNMAATIVRKYDRVIPMNVHQLDELLETIATAIHKIPYPPTDKEGG